jgi:hypothetical protein
MVEPSLAFLLRCWQEPEGDEEPTWHFSLIQINHQRKTKGFADLEALMIHLQRVLSEVDYIISGGKQP